MNSIFLFCFKHTYKFETGNVYVGEVYNLYGKLGQNPIMIVMR